MYRGFLFYLTVAVAGLCSGCGEPTSKPAPIVLLEGEDAEPVEPDAGGLDALVDAASGAPAVEATVRVINPATGAGFSGVMVTGPRGEARTDASGRVALEVESGPYQFALDAPGARLHRVWGVAGEAPFEQITYLSPEMITAFVYGSLDLEDDPTKGIVVVGLDTPSLAPAEGAGAELSTTHDAPFVFAGARPAEGQAIPAGGQGFVTFPNVEPGPFSVTTTFPDGRCRVFPAEVDGPALTAVAGEVTVVAFTCRVDP